MGGEWGVGAALAFETLPGEGRGAFSGIFQEGYALGSILASAAFALFFHRIGWRGLVHPRSNVGHPCVLCAGESG